MIAEGTLKVTFDSGVRVPSTGPYPYGSDSTLRRQCLRLSSTPDILLQTLQQLRDNDIIYYNNHFATVIKNNTGTYVMDMILTFNKPMSETGVAARQLLTRTLNLVDVMDVTTNSTTISAVSLQGNVNHHIHNILGCINECLCLVMIDRMAIVDQSN
jgi:hypothetical protein